MELPLFAQLHPLHHALPHLQRGLVFQNITRPHLWPWKVYLPQDHLYHHQSCGVEILRVFHQEVLPAHQQLSEELFEIFHRAVMTAAHPGAGQGVLSCTKDSSRNLHKWVFQVHEWCAWTAGGVTSLVLLDDWFSDILCWTKPELCLWCVPVSVPRTCWFMYHVNGLAIRL